MLSTVVLTQINENASDNMSHSPSHQNNKPILAAIAGGTFAALFLLHIVADALFSRMIAAEASLPSHASRRLQESYFRPDPVAFDRSMSLFQDEFFSSPFLIDSELMQIKNEMDLAMQRFNQEYIGTPLLRGAFSPEIWDGFGITEDENVVTVVVSVPDGVGTEDINIEVIDGAVLHVSGRVIDPMRERAENYFEKRFALGRNMEQDKIEASLKDGTLKVTTPKKGLLESKEKDVRRKIAIRDEL